MIQTHHTAGKKRERWLLLAAVLLTITAVFWTYAGKKPGKTAAVFLNGERVWEFDLEAYSEPAVVSMGELGFDVPVCFELSDHKIRFVDVDCPDKLCEGFGFISLPTQTAVCMPNRVSVSILED